MVSVLNRRKKELKEKGYYWDLPELDRRYEKIYEHNKTRSLGISTGHKEPEKRKDN